MRKAVIIENTVPFQYYKGNLELYMICGFYNNYYKRNREWLKFFLKTKTKKHLKELIR